MIRFCKYVSLCVVLAIIVVLVLTKFSGMPPAPLIKDRADFEGQVEANNIEDPVKVIVGEDIVRIHAKFKEPVGQSRQRELTFEYPEFKSEWEALLSEQGVSVEYARENTVLPSMIFQIVLLLIIIGAFWFFMIRAMKKNKPSGGSTHQLVGKRGETATVWEDLPRGAVGEAIDEAIDKNGRAILAGVAFDFDGADIRPESAAMLEAVASYLKTYPYRTFYVVGHTDPKGAMDVQLSADRAQALVDTLVNEYDIAPERLEAHGVGPLVPVRNNATDEGRAMNCRVELVER